MIASPANRSMNPSSRVTAGTAADQYRLSIPMTCAGDRDSENAVNPWRSANSTDT